MGAMEECFYSGRFKEYKKQIESILQDGTHSIGYHLLLAKSNLNTCQIASWLCKSNTSSANMMTIDSQENFVTRYQETLELVNGLPLNNELFDLSLGVLYNLGYLLLNTSQNDFFNDEWYKLMTKVLTDGFHLLGFDCDNEPCGEGDEINRLIKLLIPLTENNEGLCTKLSAIQVLVIYNLLINRKLVRAAPVLCQLWRKVNCNQDCIVGKCLLLGFSDLEQGNFSVPLPQLLSIISVAYFLLFHTGHNENLEEDVNACLKLLDSSPNCNETLLLIKQLIKGLSFWKCRKYDHILEQLDASPRSSDSTNKLSLLWKNLVGCAFSKKAMSNLAIQKFKECIVEDFSFKIPLWNVATQYRQKGLYDVELECLNLLVLSLSSQKCDASNHNRCSGMRNLIDLTLDEFAVLFIPEISLEQALYAFANRCLILNKFDVAAEKYVHLLDLLAKSKTPMVQNKFFPDIRQIHIEAAFALIKVREFDTAVEICENILSKNSTIFTSFVDGCNKLSCTIYDASMLQNTNESQSQSSQKLNELTMPEILNESVSTSEPFITEVLPLLFAEPVVFPLIVFNDTTSISKGRKRYRSNDFQVEQFQRVINADLTTSVYLVDSLIKLGKLEDGLAAVENALCLVGQGTKSDDHLATKRPRTSAAVMDSNECRQLPWFQRFLRKRVSILNAQNKTKEAIQSSRIAIQICPDDIHTWYNHVQLLKSLGRKRDAWASWLSFRKIDLKADSYRMHLLKDNIKIKKNFTTEEEQLFSKLDEESISNLCT